MVKGFLLEREGSSPARSGPTGGRMRPKEKDKNFYVFILGRQRATVNA
jgi:hypothetical protein